MASIQPRGYTVKTNTPARLATATTHEGKAVRPQGVMAELTRTASACLLFENTFYESGEDIATRLYNLVLRAPLLDVLHLAQDLRHKHGLRHAPLWLLNAALDHPALDQDDHINRRYMLQTVIANVCGSRGDMPGEMLALYRQKNAKRPLAKALARGLARAIESFSSYALQKYAARGAYRLRDVMFLVHPTPRDEVQAQWFKLLADDELPAAYTWEVELSSGRGKREVFEEMLRGNKLGALAILRNLRNMDQAGVSHSLVADSLLRSVESSKFGILPFQFVSAARAVPSMEPMIEKAMLSGITNFALEQGSHNGKLLAGHTLLMVDVSLSMKDAMSERSTLDRSDAAGAMAVLLREVCEEVSVFDFNNEPREVPARRGFALRDAIRKPSGATYTAQSTEFALGKVRQRIGRYPERIIIITDEQSTFGDSTLPALPKGSSGYVMNVAPYQNGIAWGKWTTISGFSENLVKFIVQAEQQ